MEASLTHRIARAPPPTPIATGKGLRSAAVDDRVLTRYLESSLRVPDLTLPHPHPSKSPIPKALGKTINLSSLIAGDGDSVGDMMAAAREIGVFSVDAGDFVAREEMGFLIGAGREVVGSGEEEKEVVLEEEGYRIFREKIEKVASKLELVAESIIKILSEHVKNRIHSAEIQKMHSVICLKKYDNSYRLNRGRRKHSNSHTLSLHITGNDHKFRIRTPDSSVLTLPTGSILLSIGKQFEEFCDGELKSFNGEIFLEPSDDRLDPFSVEFMYSFPVLNHTPSHSSSKIVSMLDQLLVLLILAFLYNLWS